MAERAPGLASSLISATQCGLGYAASRFELQFSCATQALVSSPSLTRGLRRGPNSEVGKGLGELLRSCGGDPGYLSTCGVGQQAFSEGPRQLSQEKHRLQEGWEDGHGEAGSAAQREQWAGSHELGI